MRSAVRQARNVFDIAAGHLAFFRPTVSVRLSGRLHSAIIFSKSESKIKKGREGKQLIFQSISLPFLAQRSTIGDNPSRPRILVLRCVVQSW